MISSIFKQIMVFVLMNNSLSDRERIHLIEALISAEKQILDNRDFESMWQTNKT